jgi:hypothetical protein
MYFSCKVTRPLATTLRSRPTAGDWRATDTNGAPSLSRLFSSLLVLLFLLILVPSKMAICATCRSTFPFVTLTFISLVDVATCA